MGIYASTFHKSGGKILLDLTDPTQSNWITSHAETCKMSIPEVQRCWSRFLMFEPDTNGNIKYRHLFSNDAFSKKILNQIPLVNDEDITFQTYCSAVSWLARVPEESKLRGLFQTLTSSALTKESLQTLLHKVYPHEGSETIDDFCKLLFSEAGKENKGVIDEDQFISWIGAMPRAQVASVLNFSIITPDVEISPGQSPSPVLHKALDDRGRVRDDQLRHVAIAMAKRKRDWRLLANSLGFLQKDSEFFEQSHHEVKDQILDMLQMWRNSFGAQIQSQTLQNALKQTGNSDIANEIFSLGF
ncbi:uncharacterized protein RCH25_000602 isoform 2-T2 [Pelodytes ibericus]